MAVEPLFVVDYGTSDPSMDRLKQLIRLNPDTTTDSTSAIVDRVTQQVRVHIYRALGADTVSAIKLLTPEENPTSADGLTYLSAEMLEANWVLYVMIGEMPVAVYDSFVGEAPLQIWNKEPLTRDIDPDLLEERRAMLWEEIQDLIGDLTEDGSGDFQVGNIGPSEDRSIHLPGQSILPYGQFLMYQGIDTTDLEGTVIIV